MRACFYLEMYQLALYEIRKYFIFVKHGELTSTRARRSGNPRQKESVSRILMNTVVFLELYLLLFCQEIPPQRTCSPCQQLAVPCIRGCCLPLLFYIDYA